MAAVADKLTYSEFQSRYGRAERSYEYWHGEARPKAMPTWIHGLVQAIVSEFLTRAGFVAGSEVELRIVPDAFPRPDVVATAGEVEDPYPTKALDVVVEILSADDSMSFVLEKCQAYHDWGFSHVYVVNPLSRQVFRWTGAALVVSTELTTIEVSRIWDELDRRLHR
jgi:Uma2 family endonuclease